MLNSKLKNISTIYIVVGIYTTYTIYYTKTRSQWFLDCSVRLIVMVEFYRFWRHQYLRHYKVNKYYALCKLCKHNNI